MLEQGSDNESAIPAYSLQEKKVEVTSSGQAKKKVEVTPSGQAKLQGILLRISNLISNHDKVKYDSGRNTQQPWNLP